MSIWNKLVGIFKKDEPAPLFYKKIVAVRGEVIPGKLELHVGEFQSSDDQPTGAAGIVIQLPVTPKLRPSVNRVLAGVETEDDNSIIELAVQKLL